MMIFSQDKGMSKRGGKGKLFIGINRNLYFLILLSLGTTFYFLVECMRSQ
jgi:hypothetical protein